MATLAGTIGFSVMLGSSAYGVTINTKRVTVDPDGSVACTAVNLSGRAIGITATIVNGGGDNVTDWIETSWASEIDGILDTVVSHSNANDARYCKVVVTGGRKSDVSVLIEAFSADGTRTGFASPR